MFKSRYSSDGSAYMPGFPKAGDRVFYAHKGAKVILLLPNFSVGE
jgi:hypothetical protein